MINPATRMPWSSTRFHCQEAYARVPGAGPKMTHWVGQVGDVLCELIMTYYDLQVKAGRRVMIRAEADPEAEPVPLWFGDLGFVESQPVDVALLLEEA